MRVLVRRTARTAAPPARGHGGAESARRTRLDKIVVLIAANMVAEVCSLYVLRADGVLELYATEGLNREAVHLTHAAASARAWSARSPAQAEPLNLADAQAHPAFAYLPETGEEIYHSFLGVPILRGGRHARRARRPEPHARAPIPRRRWRRCRRPPWCSPR